MPKFRFGLTQTVIEGATVYIDALTQEAAEELVLGKAMQGDVEWRFLEAQGDVEIVTVDKEEDDASHP